VSCLLNIHRAGRPNGSLAQAVPCRGCGGCYIYCPPQWKSSLTGEKNVRRKFMALFVAEWACERRDDILSRHFPTLENLTAVVVYVKDTLTLRGAIDFVL